MKAERNRTMKDETVTLDGCDYINCNLVRCVLKYSGGNFAWHNSIATDCTVQFHDSAERTIDCLRFFGFLSEIPQKHVAIPQNPVHE